MIKQIRNFLLKLKQSGLSKMEPQMIYSYKHCGRIIKDTRVSSSTVINSKENLELAENVFIGHYNFIESSNGISLGEGVQVTNYISILTHSSHISVRLYGREYRNAKDPIGYKKGKVTIGAYSFIGPHSTILPNTSIGKGCLVSAYSMLKGDYPDFSIISGNPAVVIGDTRSIDEDYLEQNQILKVYYDQWAK